MADVQDGAGTDFRSGIALRDLGDGHILRGRIDGEDDTLRCPWHHACFSLRSGTARVPLATRPPRSVAIVGAGAAGLACADMLRREGYDGSLTLLSADAASPCDRPNLSNDYLAGTASDDWIALRPATWYADQGIALKLARRVESIDLVQKRLRLAGDEELSADALLLPTGADPARLDLPGAAPGMVRYLRSFADFLVARVGVRLSIQVAESAGLAIDRGIAVDTVLETNAASDAARWPEPRTVQRIRVEHRVVAEGQGQVAALNLLGTRTPFTAVPFFWSQHDDVAINYVGPAEGIDAVDVEGLSDARDCAASFKRGDRVLALATIGRDRQSLEAEVAMELQA